MRLRNAIGASAAAASLAGLATYASYRKELRERCASVEQGGRIAQTTRGPIEYAEEGEGEPMLVIHGAGGGYDQGLFLGRDMEDRFRVIAPSRFGYLGTPVPADCSPANQADAHAALLDHLGIAQAIVVGASAGAPSAIEFALRHPDRISALILLVPRTYDPTDSIGPDQTLQSRLVLRVIEGSSDFMYWLGQRTARSAIVRFLGVLPQVEANASPADRGRVSELMQSILPLSKRMGGLAVDNETRLSPWPLQRIEAPTLIISAEDDLFGTLPGARYTAAQIPSAELEVLPTGGHLMVGQGSRVRSIISRFLEERRASSHPASDTEGARAKAAAIQA